MGKSQLLPENARAFTRAPPQALVCSPLLQDISWNEPPGESDVHHDHANVAGRKVKLRGYPQSPSCKAGHIPQQGQRRPRLVPSLRYFSPLEGYKIKDKLRLAPIADAYHLFIVRHDNTLELVDAWMSHCSNYLCSLLQHVFE